ncbi:hypothetical protein Hypma_009163 [Hypsizygus marmoreus]|uniref:F-box domain-containing protein n=1 Tax=Hypsizygus marmoreus TaxID=39966 RepID=A0A369JRW9_HYPMA|nr:hypothetical protein Hypma_009163 [Hypsizygus marmoreus]
MKTDSIASYPCLPVELVEIIISDTWFLPLSKDERITFMTSALLVNKAWQTLFFRLSFTHTHIPCASYLDKYLAMLCGVSPLFSEEIKSLPNSLCQSITLTIDHSPLEHQTEITHFSPQLISNLFYFINALEHVPNLRTLSIAYLNNTFDGTLETFYFNPLPKWITNLELSFEFPDSPPSLVEALRSRHKRIPGCVPWSLPSIRRLSIFGGTESLIADMVSICPEMEILQMDLPISTAGRSYNELAISLESVTSVDISPKISVVTLPSPETLRYGLWQGRLVIEEGGVRTFHAL